MNIKKMLEDQATFNRQIFNKSKHVSMDELPVIERIKDLSFGVIEETLEFLKTFQFKVHRRSKLRLQNVAHSHEELIDMYKYWLSLVDLTDFPIDRLEELYYAKSRVVQYRYQEEWQKTIDRPCVIVDIDQVLADYITGICQWAREFGRPLMNLSPSESFAVGDRLQSLQLTGAWVDNKSVGVTHLQWQQVKHDFRTRGGKRQLPVFKDAKPFLEWCRSNGWLIVLMTSRPILEYPNIFTDTLTWLHSNELPFDYVWWATEKGERLEEEANVLLRSQIVFAVDDSERYVQQFRSKGIHTFHLDRSLSFNDSDPTHSPFEIHSLHDLMARWPNIVKTLNTTTHAQQ